MIVFAIGCEQQPPYQPNSIRPASFPAFLTVPDTARDVDYVNSTTVSFVLDVSYPANDFVKKLNEEISQAGFEPLEEDFLNPGLASSHKRGWTEFIDATGKREKRIYQWLGQWRNTSDDLVWAGLKYEQPVQSSVKPKELMVNLRVFASNGSDLSNQSLQSTRPSTGVSDG